MSITGNLRTLEFAELLQWLAQGQKTGALVVRHEKAEKRIYFKAGRIISSESNNAAEHLGTFMVREGLLDEETLARALKLQESTQILLGKVLVTLGTISEEELNRILQRKTEESLYELFNWTEGDFKFIPDDLPKLPMVPIEIDVTNIVLEGAKRFDEARRDGKLGNGNYGQEIEDMLNSEIFHGVEVDEADAPSGSTEVLVSPEDPLLDPPREPVSGAVPITGVRASAEPEEASDIRAYYSGSSKKNGTKPMLAAAAAIAAIAIGVTVYIFMRPDPAAGIADRASLESSISSAVPTALDAVEEPPVPNPYLDDLLVPEENGEEIEPEPAAPDESVQIQARYEAQLDSLKAQLQQAQLAAAERDEAMNKIAELEQQVAEAQQETIPTETIEPPLNQFAVTQMGIPLEAATLSAGGDEAPPLGSPLPATEADQEAGTDFAAEMVDSVPTPPVPEVDNTVSPPVEEPEDDPFLVEPLALVKAPVLVSRPNPRYPAAAMRLGKEAVVSLRLLIDANGKVVDVERQGRDPGMGFSKAAINAALATRWEPATSDGEPIEMWAEMRITFKP